MNSSQNDNNNLRDAISNKKIMSYKLMSKVPGDRSDIQGAPQNLNLEELRHQVSTSSNGSVPSLQIEQRISSLSNNADLQVLVSPNTNEISDTFEESKTTDINDQQTIKVELNSDQRQLQLLSTSQGKDLSSKSLLMHANNTKKLGNSKDMKSTQ